MGAIVYADANGTGVTFRTWAPNATTVVVKGSFNGWGSTALKTLRRHVVRGCAQREGQSGI